MKRFIETLKNIWRIEELKNRILTTLLLVLVYRLGSFVVLPGVDSSKIAVANDDAQGIVGLINMFSGGAFSNVSIFALGIMPYISASIVIQLLGMAIPFFQRLQKEGESGRKKINQYTRFLTVAICALQAPGYLASQVVGRPGAVPNESLYWWVSSIIILISGTMFVMWLGERITDKGLGNGISLLIMVGIIARLPFAFISEFGTRFETAGGGLIMLLVELVILTLIIIGSIMLVQGTRRVPVMVAKKIVGNKQIGGTRNYIPLKVNAAGVMPIIFAQAIMFIPAIVVQSLSKDGDASAGFLADPYGFWYNVIFAVLIIAFTYFYTAIMHNPNQIAEEMKRNGGFIPGVKPGKPTAEFLDTIMSRITLPGSIFLATIAVLPALAKLMGVQDEFAQFFGGTSLLILVGVVLDTLAQIESHLLNRQYDGLMKSGRIRGRSSMSMAS